MTIQGFTGEYRWLSNFWPVQVTLDGMDFPSVEHAFQAAKTLDLETREIFQAGTAGAAKRLGRKLEVRPDWEEMKREVMLGLTRQKYRNARGLLEKLLATGDQGIVEGNYWHDNYWGQCLCGTCGEGLNTLGRILVQVREEMKPQHK